MGLEPYMNTFTMMIEIILEALGLKFVGFVCASYLHLALIYVDALGFTHTYLNVSMWKPLGLA